ncbi:hypothetical protein EDC04DRAFT_2039373 [Pisolithus marmoratus]|nr:hypothetical protein EDC04DRAFT_2039373 [Pisolithus marmoratus]
MQCHTAWNHTVHVLILRLCLALARCYLVLMSGSLMGSEQHFVLSLLCLWSRAACIPRSTAAIADQRFMIWDGFLCSAGLRPLGVVSSHGQSLCLLMLVEHPAGFFFCHGVWPRVCLSPLLSSARGLL